MAAALHRLRYRALTCLCNMLQNFRQLQQPAALWALLCGLLGVAVAAGGASAPFTLHVPQHETAEAALTDVLWALLRHPAAAAVEPAAAQLGMLATLAQTSAVAEVRMHVCGILGIIGPRTTGPTNSDVGRALMRSVSDSSLLVVAEALNGLFDTYGDERFDAFFGSAGLLPALRAALPQLQAKLRSQDGRGLGEMERERVEEALENLEGFISYKASMLR